VEEALAVRNQPTRRGLITLGIAGGIVPCPEALAILLLAIGIHQPWLGMLAVLAFSVGLAVVLIAFGVSITQLKAHGAKPLARLFGTNAGQLGRFGTAARKWLPVASALMITMIGLALMWTQLA
jgi:ABC-type nickel/cobalt efflux system permease component RcnA